MRPLQLSRTGLYGTAQAVTPAWRAAESALHRQQLLPRQQHSNKTASGAQPASGTTAKTLLPQGLFPLVQLLLKPVDRPADTATSQEPDMTAPFAPLAAFAPAAQPRPGVLLNTLLAELEQLLLMLAGRPSQGGSL